MRKENEKMEKDALKRENYTRMRRIWKRRGTGRLCNGGKMDERKGNKRRKIKPIHETWLRS